MRSSSGRWVVLAAMLVLPTIVASSQEIPVRVRGAIEQSDGHTLVVKTRGGDRVTVHFPETARIVAIVKASLNDSKPGAFIGTTALPQPDGTLRAVEVHVFPES